MGYEVLVPLGTGGRARADDDGRVTLLVVTQVREDAIALYGFAHDGDPRGLPAPHRGHRRRAPYGRGRAVAPAPIQELVGTILKSDARKLMTVPTSGRSSPSASSWS